MTKGRGFIALRLIPAGASRAAVRRPDRPFIRLETALSFRPRRAYPSLKHNHSSGQPPHDNTKRPDAPIIPLLIAQSPSAFVRTTTTKWNIVEEFGSRGRKINPPIER